MSDNQDNIQDDSGETPSDNTEQNVDNIQDTPKANEIAAEAGHKSREEFIAAGGKPELYQPPEVFLALKEPLRTLKQQSKKLRAQDDQINQFSNQMQSMQTFHTAQLESQKAQLMANRDAAIEDLDSDQAKAIQRQIDSLPQAAPAPIKQAPVQSQAVQDWSNDPKNAWIDKPGAKSTYAQSQYQGYIQKGFDEQTSLNHMETDIAREFPEMNMNVNTAPVHEGGSKPGNKPSKGVTMNDLTAEEQGIWKHSSSMWKDDQKAFLESVKNTRNAANG